MSYIRRIIITPHTRDFLNNRRGENAFLFTGGTSHLKTEQISPFATRLFIMNIQEEDEGLYICAVGPLRRPFNIVVDGKENEGQSWPYQQNYTNEIIHSSAHCLCCMYVEYTCQYHIEHMEQTDVTSR